MKWREIMKLIRHLTVDWRLPVMRSTPVPHKRVIGARRRG
jgi:hypothetical protein